MDFLDDDDESFNALPKPSTIGWSSPFANAATHRSIVIPSSSSRQQHHHVTTTSSSSSSSSISSSSTAVTSELSSLEINNNQKGFFNTSSSLSFNNNSSNSNNSSIKKKNIFTSKSSSFNNDESLFFPSKSEDVFLSEIINDDGDGNDENKTPFLVPYSLERYTSVYFRKNIDLNNIIDIIHLALDNIKVDYEFIANEFKFKCFKYPDNDLLSFKIQIFTDSEKDQYVFEVQKYHGNPFAFNTFYQDFLKKVFTIGVKRSSNSNTNDQAAAASGVFDVDDGNFKSFKTNQNSTTTVDGSSVDDDSDTIKRKKSRQTTEFTTDVLSTIMIMCKSKCDPVIQFHGFSELAKQSSLKESRELIIQQDEDSFSDIILTVKDALINGDLLSSRCAVIVIENFFKDSKCVAKISKKCGEFVDLMHDLCKKKIYMHRYKETCIVYHMYHFN